MAETCGEYTFFIFASCELLTDYALAHNFAGFAYCVILLVIVLVLFLQNPKQSPLISYNDIKGDGAKLFCLNMKPLNIWKDSYSLLQYTFSGV